MERENMGRAEGKCIHPHHYQRLCFQFKMHNKRLAAVLRPDPLGSVSSVIKRSSRPPRRSESQRREHSLWPQLRALFGEEGVELRGSRIDE